MSKSMSQPFRHVTFTIGFIRTAMNESRRHVKAFNNQDINIVKRELSVDMNWPNINLVRKSNPLLLHHLPRHYHRHSHLCRRHRHHFQHWHWLRALRLGP